MTLQELTNWFSDKSYAYRGERKMRECGVWEDFVRLTAHLPEDWKRDTRVKWVLNPHDNHCEICGKLTKDPNKQWCSAPCHSKHPHFIVQHKRTLTRLAEERKKKYIEDHGGLDEKICPGCGVKHATPFRLGKGKSKKYLPQLYCSDECTSIDYPGDISDTSVIGKRKFTNFKRYGNTNPLVHRIQTGEIKPRGGCWFNTKNNPSYDPKVIQKIQETKAKNEEENFKKRWKDKNVDADIWFDKEKLEKFVNSNEDWVLHGFYKIAEDTGLSHTTIRNRFAKLGINFAYQHNTQTQTSKIEIKLARTLEAAGIEILQNNRGIIEATPRKEIDIFLPRYNIGIEVNGNYWHKNDKTGMLEKTEDCSKQGMKLFHFSDIQLNEKFDICVSMVLAKCGIFENRKYARNLELDANVSSREAREFMDVNHIQGSTHGGSIRLGLRDQTNNELLCVMTFGKTRFSKEGIELIRFASKINHQIVGGFSRLLKNAIKLNAHWDNIISYANRCWSYGEVYEKNGFQFISTTQPSYIWLGGNMTYFTRYQTMKHKLPKLLGEENFDPNLSEKENMINAGYDQFFDCGNLKYEMKVK